MLSCARVPAATHLLTRALVSRAGRRARSRASASALACARVAGWPPRRPALARSPAGSHARSPVARLPLLSAFCAVGSERGRGKGEREKKSNISYTKTLTLCKLISIKDFLLTDLFKHGI